MQRLLITTEAHVRADSRGRVYCDGPANYLFWSQYAKAFDHVTIVARGSASDDFHSNNLRADGPRISFTLVPDFYGSFGLLQNLFRVRSLVKQAMEGANVCLLRAPGLVSHVAWRLLMNRGRRYALEVVGDPWDAFSPGSWPNALRPLARNLITRELKRMCEHASAIHYVTEHQLQQRFPPGPATHVASYSDAMLDSAFASADIIAQRYCRVAAITNDPANSGPVRIGFVGSLSRLYKGLDVLLHAIGAVVTDCGFELELLVAGSGFYLERMKALAKRLSLERQTHFLGQVPTGKSIFSLLDSIDLLILPSRAEGLPRIIIEAMARGCPCIGTDVGGIPELLNTEALVPRGDSGALGAKIVEVIRRPDLLRKMINTNLETARRFAPDVLASAHQAFLQQIREKAYA